MTTTGEAGGTRGSCAHCASELSTTPLTEVTGGHLVSMPTGGLCSCWSWGWAEVKVRRPSGSTAWTVRLENRQKREQLLWSSGEGELGLGCCGDNLIETPGESSNKLEGVEGREAGEKEEREEEKGETEERTAVEEKERDVVGDVEQQLPWTESLFPMQLSTEEEREEEETAR